MRKVRLKDIMDIYEGKSEVLNYNLRDIKFSKELKKDKYNNLRHYLLLHLSDISSLRYHARLFEEIRKLVGKTEVEEPKRYNVTHIIKSIFDTVPLDRVEDFSKEIYALVLLYKINNPNLYTDITIDWIDDGKSDNYINNELVN